MSNEVRRKTDTLFPGNSMTVSRTWTTDHLIRSLLIKWSVVQDQLQSCCFLERECLLFCWLHLHKVLYSSSQILYNINHKYWSCTYELLTVSWCSFRNAFTALLVITTDPGERPNYKNETSLMNTQYLLISGINLVN